MKKKNLLIGGGVLAVALVLYMYSKNKKQTPAETPQAPKLARGEVAVLDKDGNVKILTQQFVAPDPTEATLPTGGGKSSTPRFA